MSPQVSLARIGLLLFCMVAYGLFGGFSFPHIPSVFQPAADELPQIHLLCTLLFLVSACVASLVIHPVGSETWGWLRCGWLLLGFTGMVLSVIWMRLLRIMAEKLVQAAGHTA